MLAKMAVGREGTIDAPRMPLCPGMQPVQDVVRPCARGARGLLLYSGRCLVLSFGQSLAGKTTAGQRRNVVHGRPAVSTLTTSSQHRKILHGVDALIGASFECDFGSQPQESWAIFEESAIATP